MMGSSLAFVGRLGVYSGRFGDIQKPSVITSVMTAKHNRIGIIGLCCMKNDDTDTQLGKAKATVTPASWA